MIAAIHGILESGQIPAKALIFDGVDDYAQGTETRPNLSPTNNFEFDFRVKLGATGSQYIVDYNASISPWSLIYGFVAGKFEFYSETFTGTNPRTALTTVTNTLGVWYRVKWTYDGTTLRGYLNGVLDVERTITFTLSGGAGILYFSGYKGGVSKFNGSLDYLTITKAGVRVADFQIVGEGIYETDSYGNTMELKNGLVRGAV